MATLVLTAVGTLVGGPIGGAIGALAGQAADAQIFKPKGREGPRLADLSVQTSRYGASMPRIFGTMRVAGTVIWATDLRETSSTSGGGKGQPSLTSYSYSASFAVALSSRVIGGIGRIWADGNLLRGAEGDMKSPLGALRVHDGSAGQPVDPLIAAAVGLGQTPAFRGLAYIVLEDLQLADFGNRIPSLTVEIIADDGPVTVDTIAADLLERAVSFSGDAAPLLGFAADGSDVGEALAPLGEAFDLRWRDDVAGLTLVGREATGRMLARDAEIRALDGREEPPAQRRRAPIEDVPLRLSVRYFDPERDYQLGMQSAERPGPGRRMDEIGLPAVIGADTARQIADRLLRGRMAARRTIERACDWPALDLRAGDVVAVEGEPGAWLVDRIEWHDMSPRLSLHATAGGTSLAASGDSGQAVLPADLLQGATILAVLELAAPDDRLADAPLIFAAATGATAGWRRAALLRYHAETGVAETIGRTAPRAVIGTATEALGPGLPWRFDEANAVEILLVNEADSLIGASDDELLRGANLCALGSELLQFGRADLMAPGHYRLSRLVRGWRGTEWAAGGHGEGETLVLLDAARLAPVDASTADIGRVIALRASGSGDSLPAEASWLADGRAVLAPAPVNPALREASGDLLVGWTRRSRLGWQWRDLSDAPLGEEREAYAVTVTAGAATLRSAETAGPAWTYAAADRAADLLAAGGEPIVVEVRQIGTFGPSCPLSITL